MDDKLSFIPHINMTLNRLYRAISILFKVRNLLNIKWKFNLYNAFFLPYINYCCVIWGSATKTNLRRINSAQKHALKLILGLPRRTSSKLVYARTKALTIEDIFKLQSLVFMFKFFHDLLPPCFCNLFS